MEPKDRRLGHGIASENVTGHGRLEMALIQRSPTEVIHHSDHGCQYTSIEFGRRCREAGVRPSIVGRNLAH
jgi:transposase InsO family protein